MSELGSLLFYIVSFITSVLLYRTYRKNNKKKYLVLSFIIPVLVGGLRYMVGTDYPAYIEAYVYNTSMSTGTDLITWVSNYFGGGYELVFFLMNLLTVLFVYMGIRDMDKNKGSMALFCYYFLFFTSSFNIVRQGLALAIIFFAYRYLREKSIYKWAACIILASLFHITALIAFPFYIICNNKSYKLKVLSLFAVFISAIYYQDIINIVSQYLPTLSHYSMYAVDYLEEANNRMFFIDAVVLAYAAICRKKINSKTYDIDFLLFFAGTLLEVTGFINPFVKRIADYFLVTKIRLLPEISNMERSVHNKRVNAALIYVSVLVIFIVSVYILGMSGVIPYHFIWEESLL